MPNDVQSDDMAVRSLLMRLYHSRYKGEAFYPASVVNGEAPALEAKGWIERHQQGWRLTDLGVTVWAEMNRHYFNTKATATDKKIFDEMRERLEESRSAMAKICKHEHCKNPVWVNDKGESHSFCQQHQREDWRVKALERRQRKAAQQPDPAIEQTPVQIMPAAKPTTAEPAHDCETCDTKRILLQLKTRSPKLKALIEAMEAQERLAAELGL